MKLYLPDGNGGYKEVEMESETCVINIENIIEDQTPPYELPTMSETLKGGAAVGTGLYMNGDTLNAHEYTLPLMSEVIRGGAKLGERLYMTGESLNAEPYPTMSNITKGGAKLGTGLYMIGESLNAEPAPTMSNTVRGVAKAGQGLYMTDDTLNAQVYTLPVMSKTELGGAKLGTGLYMYSDSLNAVTYSLPTMSELIKGGAKVGQGLYMTGDTLNAETLSGAKLGDYFSNNFSFVDNKLDYSLPTMSEVIKGGAKVGQGLYMIGDTLNAVSLGGAKLGDGFKVGDDGTIDFDPLEKITLGPGLDLEDGSLVADHVDPFPTLGNGLNLDDGVLNVDPFELITFGDGFSVDGGTVTYNPMEVINLGDGLTLSSDGALTIIPSIVSSGGDTVRVENPYELPTMSEVIKGGAKVGEGLYMTGERLNTTPYTLPVATYATQGGGTLGGIKVGDGLSITYDGILSCAIDVQAVIEHAVEEATSGGSSEGHNIGVTVHDSVPADTELSIPYCILRFAVNSGVDPDHPGLPGSENWIYSEMGVLVLPAEYMDIDFKIYGDNHEEILITSADNQQTIQDNGVFGTITFVTFVGGVTGQNIATAKTSANGGTTVPLTPRMASQLTDGYIYAEWGTKSEIGNVKFRSAEVTAGGFLQNQLPTDPSHGTLCYRTGKLYLYDETTKKWLNWAVAATDGL